MNYIGKFITNFKDFYREINSATLTGAIDVVIVRQADGTYLCSPFHVRFGKIGVLRSKEKIVDIEINDEPVEVFMKLGDNGEAFFVEECTEDNENSNSTTRVMCKHKEVEKFMKLDGDDEDEDERATNLTDLKEFNLYENDFQPNEQLGSIEERDENILNDELTFGAINPSISRTKSIPIATGLEIHPYSDGECSPFNNNSPKADFDRPFSPKSDTEYEITKNENKKADVEEEFSWQWGELPQVSRKVSVASKTSDQGMNENDLKLNLNDINLKTPETIKEEFKENSEQLSPNTAGVLRDVKNELKALKEKKGYKEEGIYLDEINPENLDPEVAELYFPKLRSTLSLRKVVSDDETESGKGLSLPSNSPQRENSLTSGSDLDEKDDLINVKNNKTESNLDKMNNLENDKLDQQLRNQEIKEQEIKEQEQLIVDQINEQIKEQIPQTIDLAIVSKNYSDLAISLCGGTNSIDDEIDDDKFNKFLVTFDKFAEDSIGILQNQNLVVRLNGKYFNFQIAASFLMSMLLYQKELPANQITRLIEQQQLLNSKKKESSNRSSWWSWRRSYSEKSPQPKTDEIAINLTKDKYNQLRDGSESDLEEDLDENYNKDYNKKYHKSNYKKVLRLGSKDIENLNLREGANVVQFSVTTAYQGTSKCKCHVYLWNYDDKIIISDIDGTITKSDVLGHILPRIGRDWAQSGVANLFTKIKENGYKMLYLSARAIGQAEGTREYLKSVRQGELCLPDGPLLLSPTSLLSAFHREVIEKKPEEFKISCLKDIQALFPSNPFYAGFGNKINDTWAYRAVGIPLYRIFTINHKGELKLELIQTFQSSYTKLTSVVDHMFPPLEDKKETFTEYTSFNYWRDVLPEISLEIEREKKKMEIEKMTKPKSSPPKNLTRK